jgi:hypothetical protein
MARVAKGEPNRSEFIREQLQANRGASFRDVQAAWAAAGHKSEIKTSLYYNIKRKAAEGGAIVVKGRRGRPPRAASVAAAPVAAAGGNYGKIEEALDALLVEAMGLRNHKLVEAIRAARRIASAQLI